MSEGDGQRRRNGSRVKIPSSEPGQACPTFSLLRLSAPSIIWLGSILGAVPVPLENMEGLAS